MIVKIEWDREESAFISVAPVARFFQPFSINASHSAVVCTECREISREKRELVENKYDELVCLEKFKIEGDKFELSL